jgi:hypothetical protein
VEDTDGEASATGRFLNHTFATPGSYAVSVEVEDAAGHTGTATTIIAVADRTAPTAAALLPVGGDAGTRITLDGTASTDNDPTFPASAAFVWDVWPQATRSGSPAVTLYGARPSHMFTVPGEFFFELRVSDRTGNQGTATGVVVVRDIRAPTVSAERPGQSRAGDPIALRAHAADDDPSFGGPGGNARYVWSFTDGGRRVVLEGANATYTFGARGSYVVTVTVTDAAGNAASDTVEVQVGPAGEDMVWLSLRVAAIASIAAAVAAARPAWRRARG